MSSPSQSSIRGFTLIEVLVVIFIISIVTSVALLSISRNENRKLESFANELVQLLTLAEEQAMLQPVVLGLSLNKRAYQFTTYHPAAGEKKSSWVTYQDTLLNKHVIPQGIYLDVEVGGKKAAANSEKENEEDDDDEASQVPQVIISTNGDITPFTIYVGKPGKKPRYVITGDVDGHVSSKLLS